MRRSVLVVWAVAAIGLAVLQFSGLGASIWLNIEAHKALVGLANAISAGLGLLALVSFARSGAMRDLGLAVAFFGFTATYLWHGVYTGAEHPFQWLIYGPVSRVAFAVGLWVMLVADDVPNRRRMLWVAVVLFTAVLVAILGAIVNPGLGRWATDQPQASIQTVRLFIEAIAFVGVAIATIQLSKKSWMNGALWVGVGLLLAQSVYFAFASAWDVVWWAAHAFGAVGTASLASGVLVVTRAAEQDAQRRRWRLESRVRQDFINHAAHAMRTPLTTARISVHQLKNSTTDQKSVAALEKSLWRLADLAGQLDQASAQVTLPKAPFTAIDFPRAIGENVATYQALHPEREVTLAGKFVTGHVLFDREILDASIQQILGHAHEPATAVTFECIRRRRQFELRVHVKSPGPPEDPELLFLPFSQFNHTHASGITLAACRKAVELAGGTLYARPGREGTVFVLQLPRVMA